MWLIGYVFIVKHIRNQPMKKTLVLIYSYIFWLYLYTPSSYQTKNNHFPFLSTFPSPNEKQKIINLFLKSNLHHPHISYISIYIFLTTVTERLLLHSPPRPLSWSRPWHPGRWGPGWRGTPGRARPSGTPALAPAEPAAPPGMFCEPDGGRRDG